MRSTTRGSLVGELVRDGTSARSRPRRSAQLDSGGDRCSAHSTDRACRAAALSKPHPRAESLVRCGRRRTAGQAGAIGPSGLTTIRGPLPMAIGESMTWISTCSGTRVLADSTPERPLRVLAQGQAIEIAARGDALSGDRATFQRGRPGARRRRCGTAPIWRFVWSRPGLPGAVGRKLDAEIIGWRIER